MVYGKKKEEKYVKHADFYFKKVKETYKTIIKSNYNVYNKSVTVDDFRGISISPVVSKVFEHCILERYEKFFTTSDNQFGFKKRVDVHMRYIH